LTPFDLNLDAQDRNTVRDRFGLARLLRLVYSERFQGPRNEISLPDLERRAQNQGLRFRRGHFDRLHHGEATLEREELRDLAKVYEVEPMLLFDFLFPALRNAVVVRRPEDWRLLPAEFLGCPGVNYYSPCRRLSDSDISIAMVEFTRAAGTPVNRHPGHELLLPLEGHLEVRFGDTRTGISAGEHLFAHYHSRGEHQVANVGEDPARALVIRFYESRSPEPS
jgi:hypothetical protein